MKIIEKKQTSITANRGQISPSGDICAQHISKLINRVYTILFYVWQKSQKPQDEARKSEQSVLSPSDTEIKVWCNTSVIAGIVEDKKKINAEV